MEKEVATVEQTETSANIKPSAPVDKGMKITISTASAKIIEARVQELRKSYCSVSPSKLVDAILDIFIEKYFEKEAERIKHYLFDEKRFVRSLLKQSLSTDDFEKALKDMRKKANTTKQSKGD